MKGPRKINGRRADPAVSVFRPSPVTYLQEYSLIDDPLGFMRWARHHSRGGRSRSARFMDRRGWDHSPDFHDKNAEVRSAAFAGRGPTKKPIYPARVTNAAILHREKSERFCACGASLADKRTDSQYCSDRCRKRDVRANGTRSQYMRGEENMALPLKREIILRWCPACGVHHHVEVLAAKPAKTRKK
jgi:hypothetical protein